MRTIPTDHPLPDPLRFECEGPGVKGAKIGHDASFTLKVIDKKSLLPFDVALGDLEIFLEGPQKVPAKVHRTGNGTYKVEYKASKKGVYNLNIDYEEKPVLKGVSAVSVTIAGAVDPSKTVAELGTPNPKSGEKLSVKIIARDADGDALTVGGDTFDVEMAGPVATEPEILDFNNGTYRVDCLLPKAGRYECDIIFNETHISNSPLKFKAD